MSKNISITGATGNIGQLVVTDLLKNGAKVKALVRDGEKAKALRTQGVEVVEGNFDNAAALEKTMAGADSVLLLAPPNPNAAVQMSAMIAAVKATGKPHVIRMSALGAASDAPTENGRLHHKSDEELKASGLTYTILRPHFFMQNIFMAVPTILEQGNMYFGMGSGKLGMIDVRDIADCTVKLLLNGGYENKIETLTGPKSITFHEVATAASKAAGKPVNYVPVPIEAVSKAILDMGMGEWFAKLMMDYSKAYSEGWGDFTTETVEKITGNKSRAIDSFCSEVFSYAFQQEPAAG